MRIGIDLHTIDGPYQGTVSLWTNLIGELPSDNEYILYSFNPQNTKALFSKNHFSHYQIPIKQPMIRIQCVFPYMVLRDKCDLLHMNYYGPLKGVSSLVLSIPDVIYLDFPEFSPGFRKMQFSFLAKSSAKVAKEIITISNYSKERIKNHFEISDEKIHVVPVSIGSSWLFSDENGIENIWSELKTRLPKRYLLTVGRMDPRKNIPLAARIAKKLKKLDLVDGLVLVGPDDFGSQEIRRKFVEDKTENLVTHLKNLSTLELQAIYRHASCFLFLSVAEGFGIPIIEAMAMGTPIVASNRTSIPEVCGNAGLIVNTDDEDAIIAATEKVITDTNLRSSIVMNGLNRISLFDPKKLALNLVNVYRTALNK
ncbi:MAG: glycosyltransferase family 4 protein [Bacteroidetes bacterium]|nr:glycosyltransferase family 4 protein [Bacteroidota bacterium]